MRTGEQKRRQFPPADDIPRQEQATDGAVSAESLEYSTGAGTEGSAQNSLWYEAIRVQSPLFRYVEDH